MISETWIDRDCFAALAMTAWPQPNPKTGGTQMVKQRKKSNKKRFNRKGFEFIINKLIPEF